MLMLWSAPRSRSTAFYRMMTERGDFHAVHEPFSNVAIVGHTEIGGKPLATVPEVIAELRSLAATRQVLIKDTTDRRHPETLAFQAYCAHAGIDFRPHALNWQPSGRPEWQSFRHWFTEVTASSGWAEVPGRRRLDVEQHPLLDTFLRYHLPFYQELYQRRLVV